MWKLNLRHVVNFLHKQFRWLQNIQYGWKTCRREPKLFISLRYTQQTVQAKCDILVLVVVQRDSQAWNHVLQIFRKSRSHLVILGARRVTWNKSEDTQLLGTTVQNSVTRRPSARDLHTAALNPQTEVPDCGSTDSAVKYTTNLSEVTGNTPSKTNSSVEWHLHPSSL